MPLFGPKSAIVNFFLIYSHSLRCYNCPDKIRPKSSQCNNQSYGRKSLRFLKNSKIALSERESDPQFWNRKLVRHKNPSCFNPLWCKYVVTISSQSAQPFQRKLRSNGQICKTLSYYPRIYEKSLKCCKS